MLSFWPGFQGIARYGHWSFLGLALAFAAMLDAFLIVNFFWTAAMTPSQRNGFLLLLFLAWALLCGVASLRRRAVEAEIATEGTDETYRAALVHYLRGNWFEAESLIVPRLKKKPRDLELRLLQATLYRHSKRYDEAVLALDRLQQFDGADAWFLEIETERRFIAEARAEEAGTEKEASAPDAA